jgi:hypothetical protein
MSSQSCGPHTNSQLPRDFDRVFGIVQVQIGVQRHAFARRGLLQLQQHTPLTPIDGEAGRIETERHCRRHRANAGGTEQTGGDVCERPRM